MQRYQVFQIGNQIAVAAEQMVEAFAPVLLSAPVEKRNLPVGAIAGDNFARAFRLAADRIVAGLNNDEVNSALDISVEI